MGALLDHDHIHSVHTNNRRKRAELHANNRRHWVHSAARCHCHQQERFHSWHVKSDASRETSHELAAADDHDFDFDYDDDSDYYDGTDYYDDTGHEHNDDHYKLEHDLDDLAHDLDDHAHDLDDHAHYDYDDDAVVVRDRLVRKELGGRADRLWRLESPGQ
jgi:hypothetical protein